MKERQRWRAEEDAILCAYVKQCGPRDWHLVGQRMNAALHRDAKSCQERWKNYLRPGVKKGALTDEEQRLVIRLQAQYGNKWKKIAAEVPGRTAKRLGKWWEVFKEQQHRVLQRQSGSCAAVEPGKYDSILESFAEKLVEQEEQQHCHRRHTQLMATPLLPAWLSSNNGGAHPRPPSPSVALTLSPATAAAPARAPWQLQAPPEAVNLESGSSPFAAAGFTVDGRVVAELVECCKELEEGHRAWAAQKKEASWRLKRVELQLEAEMAAKRREKMEEMEAKMRALQEEQQAAMERIEAEYRDQIAGLRRDAEAKEQKLAEAWTAKHVRLSNFLDQFGCRRWLPSEINGR